MFMVKFLGYGAKNLSETELACGAFDMGSAGNSTLRGTSPPETETWIPACARMTGSRNGFPPSPKAPLALERNVRGE